jgi:hypothetical protein
MVSKCIVEGCLRPVMYKAAGLCQMHYHRRYRGQSLGGSELRSKAGRWPSQIRSDPICSVEGCDKPRHAIGLCSMHEARLRRHGDVSTVRSPPPRLGADNGSWIGDEASYHTIHNRVRYQRGPASSQVCALCGNQALHWSYDHTDTDERAGLDGPYSLDLARYRPLCVPCHKVFDLSLVKGTDSRRW